MGSLFHYIYKTTNMLDGQIYVGQRSSHCEPKQDNYLGSSNDLKADIKKFGRNNFSKDILEVCEYNDLSTKEKEWIIKLDAVKCGYNKHVKGTGQKLGFTHTDACKKQMSEDRKGTMEGENNPMYGRTGENSPMFGVDRKGEKAAMWRKNHSQKTIDKLSKINSDGRHKGENNNFYGKTHTQESIDKISKAKTGVPSGRKGVNFSEEHVGALKESWKNRKEIKCPYCDIKSKNVGNMKRYHFDNCKFKIDE